MKGGVLESGLSSMACGPPKNMSSWPQFISSLEIGLDVYKSKGNLEMLANAHRNIIGDIEKFLDCIKEESERIIKFYKNKEQDYKFEMPKEIYHDINHLDVQFKLIDYAKEKDKNNPEKFYCKLIADLRFATSIILGKEKGPLGGYEKHLEDTINYLKANGPLTWEERPHY